MHVQIILDSVKVYLLGKASCLVPMYVLFVLSCLFVMLVNFPFLIRGWDRVGRQGTLLCKEINIGYL